MFHISSALANQKSKTPWGRYWTSDCLWCFTINVWVVKALEWAGECWIVAPTTGRWMACVVKVVVKTRKNTLWEAVHLLFRISSVPAITSWDLDCFAGLLSEYSSCSIYRTKDISFMPSRLAISACPPCPSLPAPNLYKHGSYHRHLQLSACFMKPGGIIGHWKSFT